MKMGLKVAESEDNIIIVELYHASNMRFRESIELQRYVQNTKTKKFAHGSIRTL